MPKIWTTHETNGRLQADLSAKLNITPVFAQLLINRGIRTGEQARIFLFGDISSCHDPFLMKDMDRAVARVLKALANNEKVLIYGDYDVDGVTSTALLSFVFAEMGIEHEAFIPNRLEEGYGMNVRAVALARERGVGLIVTVDCGINSFEEVECANSYGIDVVITDHHELRSPVLPEACAVIDPHRDGCDYPFKGLAGVGVAYKFAKALECGRAEIVDKHLDLVALGTIADVSPMTGENRLLTRAGLKQLGVTQKKGLKALIDVARIRSEKLTCRDIGFGLAPRINAIGRVGSANTALELMMCDDDARALGLAKMLDKENRNRQAIEKDLLDEAMVMAEDEIRAGRNAIIISGDSWHPGVLGIVASRLADNYNIPAILVSFDGDTGKGSGRSAGGINLFDSISMAGEHLLTFGGHESACGLKIGRENITGFKDAMDGILDRVKGDIVSEKISIDINVPFSGLGIKLVNELHLLMPYGPGNEEPVFSSTGLIVKNVPRDIGKNGFKFLVSCGNLTCEAVTFRKNRFTKPRKGERINLAFTPSINRWGGIETIQLMIKDIQPLA